MVVGVPVGAAVRAATDDPADLVAWPTAGNGMTVAVAAGDDVAVAVLVAVASAAPAGAASVGVDCAGNAVAVGGRVLVAVGRNVGVEGTV